MTFEQFAFLLPGSILYLRGAPVVYVRPQRDHPMAQHLSQVVGLPITEDAPPLRSVMGRLREAWSAVRAPCAGHGAAARGALRPLTDAEILARETERHPCAYYTALVRDVEGRMTPGVSPLELDLHPGPPPEENR